MGRGTGRVRPVSRLPAGQPAEARPGPIHADLHGRQPVRIRAEGTDLVAYGFGEQRIVVPAGSVSEVIILGAYHEVPIWSPLILLDRHKRVLLEAPGMWGPELNRVLQSLGLPHPVLSPVTSARGWRHAPGYQKLRVLPPGYSLARGALFVTGVGMAGLGASLGMLPALAWLSSETWAQGLAGLAGVAAGGVAGASLSLLAARAAQAVARWAVAARSVRTPPPVSRFFPGPGQADGALLTAVTVLSVPALLGWGPVLAGVTLARGTASVASLVFAALATVALPVMARRAVRRLRDRQRRPGRRLARELGSSPGLTPEGVVPSAARAGPASPRLSRAMRYVSAFPRKRLVKFCTSASTSGLPAELTVLHGSRDVPGTDGVDRDAVGGRVRTPSPGSGRDAEL